MMNYKDLPSKFLDANIIQADEVEICHFGLECLFLKIVMFISYMAIAISMGRLKEFGIIMLVFMPLRRNIGGYHAKTRVGCYFLSCGLLALILMACKIQIHLYTVLILLTGVSVIFWMTMPIDNENKKMDVLEKHFFQVKARKVILLINVAVILLLLLNMSYLCKDIVLGMIMELFFLVAGKVQDKDTNISND